MNEPLRFSVVIPTLNEEELIGRGVQNVRTVLPDAEIIIADGGSTDRTPDIVRKMGVCLIKVAPAGRGRQCNVGGNLATGDILLFLHADTRLPGQTGEFLDSFFQNPKNNIGTFALDFDRSHWFLRIISWYTRRHRGRIRFGDSGITIRKSLFKDIGGFPNQRLFEDFELLKKASRISPIRRFQLSVVTSARRFDRTGPVRQSLKNAWLTLRYMLGTPAGKLAAVYEKGNNRAGQACVLMMCRLPIPGRVKTRLAAGLGADQATAIYSRCVETLFAAVDELQLHIEKRIYAASAADAPGLRRWSGHRYAVVIQPEGDLGARLEKGFADAFKAGFKKVIITASDVPAIDTAILEQALNGLNDSDIVIGPSPDGGYYLIGLRRDAPKLFKDIPWSSGEVLAATSARAKELGMSIHRLTELADIDTVDDWREFEKGLSAIQTEKTTDVVYG
ncbi:Protein of unknown function DUF2064 [Dehalogenimonas lykanthroporepellens BL-DC-9]|nr:Protein of unknown function DUF2064 [Dehalogenimonas lykanthroporepellens BL-DC-9]